MSIDSLDNECTASCSHSHIAMATSAQSGVIPFNSLVSGSAGVRVTYVYDTNFMSVRDIIMIVCDKDGHEAVEIWRSLAKEYQNLDMFCSSFLFKGRCQPEQPVITLQ